MRFTKDREQMYLDKLLAQEREIAYMRYKLEEKESRIKNLGLRINFMSDDAHRLRQLLDRARMFIPVRATSPNLREDIKQQLEFSEEYNKSA